MKRILWILWLRACAYALDAIGRKHYIRRRLGQLTRRKPEPIEQRA